MKEITLSSLIVIVLSVFCSITYSTVLNDPQFKWVATSHDFGKIKKGQPVTFMFKFTNTGGAPLIINSSKGSCGCTTATFSREPIAPGKTGYVEVTHNASAIGTFNKVVTVSSNASEIPDELNISGEVVE